MGRSQKGIEKMKITIQKNILAVGEIDIRPDTCQSAPPSKSGKTRVVYTTGGFLSVPDRPDLQISINLIYKGK